MIFDQFSSNIVGFGGNQRGKIIGSGTIELVEDPADVEIIVHNIPFVPENSKEPGVNDGPINTPIILCMYSLGLYA